MHLAEEPYKQGLSSVVELDDAQRRFTEDSAAYVTALYDYSAAKAAVERASGESLTPSNLGCALAVAPSVRALGLKGTIVGAILNPMRTAPALMAALLVVAGMSVAVHAELWCGRGPGTPLDHPCSDEDTEEDPAVTAAVASHTNEWMMVHGVWQVSAGTIQTGTPHEIIVYVEPSGIAAVRQQIPSEVDNIPVRLVAKKLPMGAGPRSFSKVSQSDPAPYDPAAPERQASARLAEAVYAQTMREYGEQWNDLPGVVSLGPKKCDERGCDFSAIQITVQAQFMSDVKEQVTDSVDGIPIVFVPYNGGDQ